METAARPYAFIKFDKVKPLFFVCLVWFGLVWFGFGLVWFGLVWFGLVWFGSVGLI